MRKWLSVLSLLLCALLVSMPALAEDCFLINVDQFHGHQVPDLMDGEHRETHILQEQQQTDIADKMIVE